MAAVRPESPSAAEPTRRIALVAGASRGIGAAIALELARDGYAVALLARSRVDLEQVAAAIAAGGGAALVVVVDVTDPRAAAAAVDQVRRWGQLEVVVANAGVYRRGLACDVTRDDLEAALRDNFWSAFHVIAAALPTLRAQRRGQVVIVNSFDAKKGLAQDSAYAAAKAALASYAASLRQALHRERINVCSVFPGRVDTAMVADLEVPWISAKIPAERVARAVRRGLRRRRAEIVVPWHVRPLWWCEVLSPRLADWLARVLRLDGRPRA